MTPQKVDCVFVLIFFLKEPKRFGEEKNETCCFTVESVDGAHIWSWE